MAKHLLLEKKRNARYHYTACGYRCLLVDGRYVNPDLPQGPADDVTTDPQEVTCSPCHGWLQAQEKK